MKEKYLSEKKIKAIILSKIVKTLIYNSEGVYSLREIIDEEDSERKYEEKRKKKKLRETIKEKELEREGKKKEPDLKDIVEKKSFMRSFEKPPQENIPERKPSPKRQVQEPKKELPQEENIPQKEPRKKPQKEFEFKPLPKPRTPNVKNVPPQKRVLRIPAPRLPQRFSYLKPTPGRSNIELGKLNALINDPAVRAVECLGPNTEIFVSGAMGRKKTSIVLSNDEINQIIDKFSEKTKIPAEEGVYRVVAGNLVFSAVISSVANTRFIIRKMAPQNQQPMG